MHRACEPHRAGRAQTRKKNLHVAHSGTLVGSVAQWIAHWTSRLLVEAIQRLWVQVPPAGHPYSVVKTTLLGCAVPGHWPRLWIL